MPKKKAKAAKKKVAKKAKTTKAKVAKAAKKKVAKKAKTTKAKVAKAAKKKVAKKAKATKAKVAKAAKKKVAKVTAKPKVAKAVKKKAVKKTKADAILSEGASAKEAVAKGTTAKSKKTKKSKVVVVEGAAKKEAAAGKKAAAGKCKEPGCDQKLLLMGYCRLHYIKNWRMIKRKAAILAAGQLNEYVEELVSKYPDKYLELIRADLASEKDWAKVVLDLELESSDEELDGDDEIETIVEKRPRSSGYDDDGDDVY